MRKFVTIFILSCYLLLNIGVDVSIHTCGGFSEAFLVTSKIIDPCGCDDLWSPDRCCTAVMKTIKIDDLQKSTVTNSAEEIVTVESVDVSSFIKESYVNDSKVMVDDSSPPPFSDLTIQNSVFLI